MTGCTSSEDVLQHILFHKSIISDDDGRKLDRYLEAMRAVDTADRGDIDRSLTIVFELVLSNDLDPWDIDLLRFAQLYADRVKGQEVNFVLAGRLMLMAWSILRMQSEKVLQGTESEEPSFDDECPEWCEEAPRQRLCMPDEIDLDEVVRRHGPVPVTLVELLDAFDAARREEAEALERERRRAALKAAAPKAFETRGHDDDMERDVEEIWARVQRCGPGLVSLQDILEGGREDMVKAITSLLFLARAGRVAVWQDDLPYGPIHLEARMDWSIGTLEDAAPAPAPAARNRELVM